MTDQTQADLEDRGRAERARRQEEWHAASKEGQDPAGGQAAHDTGDLSPLAYPDTLLASPSLQRRANEPVQVALMQQMQQTYGNRAVQRWLHPQHSAGPLAAVQRGPAPHAGWSDAPESSPNAAPDKGKILRIPLEGLAVGYQGDAKDSAAAESAKGKAIALVPASLSGKTVDVLLHLHGYGVGYRTRQKQLTSNPAGGGHDVEGGEPGTVRDISLDRTAEQIEQSGHPMVGVLPQGGLKSQFGDFNSDTYISAVFEQLKQLGKLPKDVQPGRVILSAHSGGGDRIANGLDEKGFAPKQMAELVLFDAINREDDKVDEVATLSNWLQGKLNSDLKAIRSLGTDAEKAAWLKANGFRFRGYHSASPGYTSRYKSLGKKLDKWFSDHAKALGGESSSAYKALRDNYQIIATGVAEHEQVMGKSGGFKESIEALPATSASGAATTQTPAAKEPALSRMAAPVQRQVAPDEEEDDELPPVQTSKADTAVQRDTPADAGTAPAQAPTQAPATDADIDALDLDATAKAGAVALRKQHPGIKFTSGRRSVASQASAMAENIVSDGRKWIENTYAKSAARDKLQKWVDDHPDAKSQVDLAKGLQETMEAMSADELAQVSKHLSGEAFDVQPQTKDADQIKADIKALPGVKKFLEKEGGLVRWHVQF